LPDTTLVHFVDNHLGGDVFDLDSGDGKFC
jgi:hypothetical protein